MENRQKIHEVEKKYNRINTKYFRSNTWSYFFKLIMPTLSLVSFILALVSIQGATDSVKPYFITMAILSAIMAFITTIIGAFTFGVLSKRARAKVEEIQKETDLFESNQGDYKESKNRLQTFIRNITKIDNK